MLECTEGVRYKFWSQVFERQSVRFVLNEFQALDAAELDHFFDIEATVSWLNERKYLRIALQFPDQFLCVAVKVARRLEELCDSTVKSYILADASYKRYRF